MHSGLLFAEFAESAGEEEQRVVVGRRDVFDLADDDQVVLLS